MDKQQKTYVLYHGNCPDGTGAAMAAWIKLGDEAIYIPVNYGQDPPPIERGSRVFIIDFSYPRSVLENLGCAVCDQLVVLDHHATAQRDLEGLPGCHFDMTKSGAVLAWEYFHPGTPVPEFILYLQDRDLWKFELPKSREVSMALRSYPMEFREWVRFMDRLPQLAEEGVVCKRLTDQQVDQMARKCCWLKFHGGDLILMPHDTLVAGDSGIIGPCANASVFFSEVGERLLELHPSHQWAAYYFDRSDGLRQWGLRSRPGFDCSALAKLNGGGGHKQAAGFITKQPLIRTPISQG